jgi:gluconokinase
MGFLEPDVRYGRRHGQAALTASLAIVVMGVSGCGKTTAGQALAAHLGCRFLEGDSFHSDAAKAKMTAGIPLTDEDRWPWLDRLGNAIGDDYRAGHAIVAACSALKQSYRDRLLNAANEPLSFVWLHAPEALLRARLEARKGHYMPASLLTSQLAVLEPPIGANAFSVDASGSTKEMIGNVLNLFPDREKH